LTSEPTCKFLNFATPSGKERRFFHNFCPLITIIKKI